MNSHHRSNLFAVKKDVKVELQLKQKWCVKISHRCGRSDSVVLTLSSLSVVPLFATQSGLDGGVSCRV